MERLNILVTSPRQGRELVTQDIRDEPDGGCGAVRHVPGGLHVDQPGGVVGGDGHGAGHPPHFEGQDDDAALLGAALVVVSGDTVDQKAEAEMAEEETLAEFVKNGQSELFVKARVALNGDAFSGLADIELDGRLSGI